MRRSLRCHKMSRFVIVRRVVIALVVALAAFSHDSAHAQTVQSMRIVVPFAAGGGADILARLLADEFSRAQKVSAVVENRVGGGTVIATEAVARATPDGSTLLQNANSFVINPSLRKVNYDPFTSFEPVCNLVGTPMFVVVPSNSPYQKLGDLLEAARANPGGLKFCQPRAGDRAAHCLRDAQAQSKGGDDLHTLSRQCAGHQRHDGRSCAVSHRQLS